ncbi:hypothetical protein MLD63_15830 [Paracoccus sp. TK19116]|uniref:Permease n=1 Tax=Paracoccus albicereus TaxID=2922394 RepID=A0ABT1MU80_9RHOB|nr:hypothetical protein [Paracoccus albicereus]MCQ0971892.1 hypothetical protein [Paracoccus albicereus]
MNDMEWGGPGDGSVGALAGLENLPEEDRKVILEAMNKSKEAENVDEVNFISSLFLSYVADMQRDYQDMRAGRHVHIDADALKKAVKSAREVRDALTDLRRERDKVDKLRKDIAGSIGGGSLDLDAARDEVGRRLACLRRAAGS